MFVVQDLIDILQEMPRDLRISCYVADAEGWTDYTIDAVYAADIAEENDELAEGVVILHLDGPIGNILFLPYEERDESGSLITKRY